jgi:hypothetical protein
MGDFGPSNDVLRWLGLRVGKVWDFFSVRSLLAGVPNVAGDVSDVERIKAFRGSSGGSGGGFGCWCCC